MKLNQDRTRFRRIMQQSPKMPSGTYSGFEGLESVRGVEGALARLFQTADLAQAPCGGRRGNRSSRGARRPIGAMMPANWRPLWSKR